MLPSKETAALLQTSARDGTASGECRLQFLPAESTPRSREFSALQSSSVIERGAGMRTSSYSYNNSSSIGID